MGKSKSCSNVLKALRKGDFTFVEENHCESKKSMALCVGETPIARSVRTEGIESLIDGVGLNDICACHKSILKWVISELCS